MYCLGYRSLLYFLQALELDKLLHLSMLQYKKETVVASGEGNGTPLQYSCLENPMDGGAW